MKLLANSNLGPYFNNFLIILFHWTMLRMTSPAFVFTVHCTYVSVCRIHCCWLPYFAVRLLCRWLWMCSSFPPGLVFTRQACLQYTRNTLLRLRSSPVKPDRKTLTGCKQCGILRYPGFVGGAGTRPRPISVLVRQRSSSNDLRLFDHRTAIKCNKSRHDLARLRHLRSVSNGSLSSRRPRFIFVGSIYHRWPRWPISMHSRSASSLRQIDWHCAESSRRGMMDHTALTLSTRIMDTYRKRVLILPHECRHYLPFMGVCLFFK